MLWTWVGNVAPLPRPSKTTMYSQGPDHVPNFSKMALCISLRVHAGNLIGKCAPPARVMGNQQCPARLQAIPSTFPNCSFADMLGCRLGAWVGNVIPLPRQSKTTMFNYGFHNTPNLFQPSPLHFCYETKRNPNQKNGILDFALLSSIFWVSDFLCSHTQ